MAASTLRCCAGRLPPKIGYLGVGITRPTLQAQNTLDVVIRLFTTTRIMNPSFQDLDSQKDRKPVSQKLKIKSSYLTPFPYLTKEDLEEPPRRVSAPVARILENSKARVVDGVLIKPKYNARKFAMLRKRYISEGYYWPEKPMRDRTLDKAPTGTLREKRREERKKMIEQAMKDMPNIVAAYRKRVEAMRAKKRQEKEKNKLKIAKIQAMGLHPNDPKAKKILHEGTSLEKKDDAKAKKKKFQKT